MLLLHVPDTVLETNCYVLAEAPGAAALVVDPGAGAAQALGEHLAAHDLRVGAVALTHGHADHVWDAAAVAGEAPVYVGPGDRYRLADPAGALGAELGAYFARAAGSPWQVPAQVSAYPAGCLTGGGAPLVPGVVVRAVPAPGHTEGSTVLLVRGALATPELLPAGAPTGPDGTSLLGLCGDVLFAGSMGRTDLPGGDEAEMTATLTTLARALPPETVLLPGHGPATTLAAELATNPYLRRAASRR
ncbi:MBL fold metallo-hydrolase [Georgenia sp. TF02-10]|uniref:MBL fold metallo-hydrolase n=1 Tax=Georgenia sp. TF02-10 TaxID=2917725 RepID=UPI001FA7A975|nr:MBL fold metallo-hydrolase [Georgenia sp. TF02-10]UNX53269.1 MBL fold metallo-hydrolase [Georgenia sp. TF02-10]